MSKKPSLLDRPFKDTRGLATGLDPRNFYEYSSQKRRQVATGLEGLLYRLMPYTLIGSLAFAIDPFSQFKTAKGRITPTNRVRIKRASSIFGNRSLDWKRTVKQAEYRYGVQPNQYTAAVDYVAPLWHEVLPAQQALIARSEDTTSRTRIVGSDNGEFRKWNPHTINSPSRSVERRDIQKVQYIGTPTYWFNRVERWENHINGPSATISTLAVESLRQSEWAWSVAEMQKRALGLFKGLTAQGRTYTLARNVVELKDLPRGILQLQESFKHLRELAVTLKIPGPMLERIHSFKIIGTDIPKEYLSYSFGWSQLYRDTRDLLLSPTKIGKRINFLIARNGKATTYRSSRSFETDETLSSGFAYSQLYEESPLPVPVNHSLTRKCNMKMVVNSIFEFPDVDLPSFRDREWKRQLGLTPTPTDLYNLVPWSWLVDWFTGLGNYVEVIDNINSDRELINWGMCTLNIEGTLTSQMSSKTLTTISIGTNSDVRQYSQQNQVYTHQSSLQYTSQVRKDLATLFNVKETTDISTLSGYQASILGALILGRSNFRR